MYLTTCPMDCSGDGDDPVCGSDGNIYRNRCEMKRMTCGFPLTRYERVTVVDFELCEPKRSTCGKVVCPEPRGEKDQVCGNDGITYGNQCLLRKATCTSGVNTRIKLLWDIKILTKDNDNCMHVQIELSHLGPCTDLSKRETCPRNCDGEDDDERMVCGSDGNAYRQE